MYFKVISLFFFISFINKVGLQSQQAQAGIVDLLSSDGQEPVTSLKVIKEIYAFNQPMLLAMLHLSLSEFLQNMKIWASYNDENKIKNKPRSDALMLEIANALEEADKIGEGTQLRTALTSKRDMLDRLFTFGGILSPWSTSHSSGK